MKRERFDKVIVPAAFVLSLLAASNLAAQKEEPGDNAVRRWDFEAVAVGKLPEGWKVEATNPKGVLGSWKVIEEKSAPSGKKVLALTEPSKNIGTYNLCWTDAGAFLDGEISVFFKAVKGKMDQGGGIIWRVKDNNNYYIARFNPLESNFRLYYVKEGKRQTLKSSNIELPVKSWHSLKVVQKGPQMECYLNGKKLLEASDTTFPDKGGVGLWTKADAATYFDNFEVKSDEPETVR